MIHAGWATDGLVSGGMDPLYGDGLELELGHNLTDHGLLEQLAKPLLRPASVCAAHGEPSGAAAARLTAARFRRAQEGRQSAPFCKGGD